MKYLAFYLVFSSLAVFGKTTIITTLPELKWVVDEIVTKKMKVISLLEGSEDPHFVDATPSFILKVSKADLVIANGLQLEIGWLPKVIEMAGNAKIQFGAIGYCDASAYVEKKQIIKNFNRSMGDVHPLGNPHYTLSINQMKFAAKKIFECLTKLEPNNENLFKSNYNNLIKKLTAQLKKNKEELKSIKNNHFMTYHREFIYFFNDFNLNSVGTLEKVPGILPSAAHLFNISKIAKSKNVKLVLASITNPQKYLDKFKESTNIAYVQLPLHMNCEFKSYLEFQDFIAGEILKNVKSK